MSLRRRLIVLLCAAVAVTGLAGQELDESVERERIANERAAAETRFAEERLACQKNFVVTSCIDEARRRERATLDHLRRQEAVLDDAQRKRRAADRMAAIRAKVGAEQARRPAPARAPKPEVLLRREPPRAGRPAEAVPAVPAASTAEGAAREARARARFEGRQREARAQREAAQQRAAQRAKEGRQVAPLPVPPAASAAAR